MGVHRRLLRPAHSRGTGYNCRSVFRPSRAPTDLAACAPWRRMGPPDERSLDRPMPRSSRRHPRGGRSALPRCAGRPLADCPRRPPQASPPRRPATRPPHRPSKRHPTSSGTGTTRSPMASGSGWPTPTSASSASPPAARRSRSTATTATRTTRRGCSRTPRRSPASSSSATSRRWAASSAASPSTTSPTRTATGPARRCPTTRRTASARARSSATPSCGGASAGRTPAEIRGGWQVINWGESTFIQGGINAINPVDVSVLRVPGAELRDALLPVGAVKFSIKPSANTSLEAFYQYAWEETKIDPVGSYFSTSDLAGRGRVEGHARLRLGARHGGRRPRAAAAHLQPGGHGRAEAQRGHQGQRRRAVRRRAASSRSAARQHRVRPLLPELPQPPAAASGHRPAPRADCSPATTPRPPTTSSSTRKTSSSSAPASTPSWAGRASRCRAKSRTAWTCRCRSTTSNCSTRR